MTKPELNEVKGEWTVVGDSGEYKECLIYVCGTKERAEEVLNKMLTNPDKTDLYHMKNHTNLKIKFEPAKDCWWNDPFLAN